MTSLIMSKKVVTFQNCSRDDELFEEMDCVERALSLKHPLLHTWTLWYYKTENTKEWSENQREVLSFNTAEDFWALFNYIQPVSNLSVGCDYSVFKKGVRPMWEDAANKDGGRWLLSVDKRCRNIDLDHYWLEMLLCMVGESLTDETDEVCGAVINIRTKVDRLALWTRHALNADTNIKIGRILKNTLNLEAGVVIEYQAHNDTISKTGNATKCLYTI